MLEANALYIVFPENFDWEMDCPEEPEKREALLGYVAQAHTAGTPIVVQREEDYWIRVMQDRGLTTTIVAEIERICSGDIISGKHIGEYLRQMRTGAILFGGAHMWPGQYLSREVSLCCPATGESGVYHSSTGGIYVDVNGCIAAEMRKLAHGVLCAADPRISMTKYGLREDALYMRRQNLAFSVLAETMPAGSIGFYRR